MTPTRQPLWKIIARIAAVGVALSVLGCYVYDAQYSANQRQMERERSTGPEAGEPPATLSSSKSLAIEPEGGFLSSSKSRALAPAQGELPAALPSSKGIAIDPNIFLSGSKSGVIADPDFVPLPPRKLPAEKPQPVKTFLFSSKSAAPVLAEVKKKIAEEKKAKGTKTAPKK